MDLEKIKEIVYADLSEEELEKLATASAALSRQRFGNTMQLYAPLYLSNECVNNCTYCGFSSQNKIPRRTLNPEEVLKEAQTLRAQGIEHLLLVAGEHPKHVGLDYLKEVMKKLRGLFAAISIEIAPLEEEDYRELSEAGVSGLVVYQETYNREIYNKIHVSGPKKDYDERKKVLLKGARAGMRFLGMGLLYGLAPWQEDFLALMEHAFEVQKKGWKSALSFSFPRLRDAEGFGGAEFPFSDRDFVKAICLTRLAFPEAVLTLSTRESASLRDSLLPLGFTMMSAGSKTNPGGYEIDSESLKQFDISDERSIAEIKTLLKEKGFDPISKDWEPSLHQMTGQ
jgi:2-iminoacetate synthase